MLQSVCRLVIAALFLFPCTAAAEVPIAPGSRVTNVPPGRCAWCAVETLARHHHIASLYGLTREHAVQAHPEDLKTVLSVAHVRFRIQERGEQHAAILRDAIVQGLGAVVGFRELYPGSGGHIVTVIDFGPQQVLVIDPNDQDKRTRSMPLELFLFWWDGFALVLEGEQKH